MSYMIPACQPTQRSKLQLARQGPWLLPQPGCLTVGMSHVPSPFSHGGWVGALLTAAKPRIACLACLLPCLSLSGALFWALNYCGHTHSILFSRVSLSTGYRAQDTGHKARYSILTRVLEHEHRGVTAPHPQLPLLSLHELREAVHQQHGHKGHPVKGDTAAYKGWECNSGRG